jgi:hypothetical protein
MRIYRGPSAVPNSGRRARLGSTFAGPALHPFAYLQRKERAVANEFLGVEIAERRSTGSSMTGSPSAECRSDRRRRTRSGAVGRGGEEDHL